MKVMIALATAALAVACSDWRLNEAEISWAVYHGDTGKVAVMLQQGANPNQRGGTKEIGGVAARPLHVAALFDRAEIALLLLKAGADPNGTDHLERTPLHNAASRGFLQTARVLVTHGANVNAVDRHRQSVLSMARETKNEELIAYLEAAGATVEGRVAFWQRSRLLRLIRRTSD